MDLSGGSDVRSLRLAFVEVHEELEAKFPDYEAHSKEHSHMSQVYAAFPLTCLFICCTCSARAHGILQFCARRILCRIWYAAAAAQNLKTWPNSRKLSILHFLPLALCIFCTTPQFPPNLLQVTRVNQYCILSPMGTVT